MSSGRQLSRLQDPFLSDLSKEGRPVSIFLLSGVKLHGVIDGFDQFALFLRDGETQIIYKQAIASVVPAVTDQSSAVAGRLAGAARSLPPEPPRTAKRTTDTSSPVVIHRKRRTRPASS